MDRFIEFIKEGLGELVRSALNEGLPLLNDNLTTNQKIIEIVSTFAIQLLIILVLFLIVRFKFWNIVTGFIEKREKAVQESIDNRSKALEESENIKTEAAEIIKDSKVQANNIIEEARKISVQEANNIKQDALEEINQERLRAYEQIEHDRAMMEKDIHEEIIDVAYEMSKTIIGKEIDQENSEEILNEALKKLEKSE